MAMQTIQPRSPKQNGDVGRCRRTGRRELHETSSVAATPDEYRRDARRIARFTTTLSGPIAAPSGRTPIGDPREHPGESLRRKLTAPAGKPTSVRTRPECRR